jgi:hypothetical protein
MTSVPRQSYVGYVSARAPAQWVAADFWERRELLHQCLDYGGGASVPELVAHFGADRHEVVAKLKSLRTDGRVTYNPRHKWWSAVFE